MKIGDLVTHRDADCVHGLNVGVIKGYDMNGEHFTVQFGDVTSKFNRHNLVLHSDSLTLEPPQFTVRNFIPEDLCKRCNKPLHIGPCTQPESPTIGDAIAYGLLKKPDHVNHPKHYTAHPSGVECIDVVRHMNFNLGNVFKYLWRSDHKNDTVEDLEKAAWYLNDEIKRLKNQS